MRYQHEKLIAYQKGLFLVKSIFQFCDAHKSMIPNFLYSQITRSSISYVSNIVEGVSRSSKKEKRRFIEIAYGSLLELDTQVVLAKSIRISSTIDVSLLRDQIEELVKITSGLKRSFNDKL